MMRALLIMAVALGAGCAPIGREGLKEEILKHDPEFAKLLDERDELANRIDTIKRELALKRRTTERTISQLRQEVVNAASQAKGKVDEIRKQFAPTHARVESLLALAAEELRAKRLQRASLGREISQLRKAAKHPPGTWTEAERAQHEAQLAELRRDAERLDVEIAAIQEHVRLMKIKLILLKL